MTSENQALLDAIQGIVERAIAPLTEQVDGLTKWMHTLNTRVEHLENRVEAIDTRSGQMAAVLLDLRDRVPLLEERVDNGFRALKSDLNFAFSDARKVSMAQNTYEKTIDALRKDVASIQQRLTALERSQGAS